MISKPQIAIASLDDNAANWCEKEHPYAYFATVFRFATRLLQNAINTDRFEHPQWVADITNNFIRNYVGLLQRSTDLVNAPRCWRLAFLAATAPRTTILQHFFLALSAHLRLTLPVSIGMTLNPSEMDQFKNDFDEINLILATHYQLVWRWVKELYRLEAVQEELIEPMPGLQVLFEQTGLPKPLDALEQVWFALQKYLGADTREEAFQAAKDLLKNTEGSFLRIDIAAETAGRKLYRPHWTLKPILEALQKREEPSVSSNCFKMAELANEFNDYCL